MTKKELKIAGVYSTSKFILLIHSDIFHQSNKSEITIVGMNSCRDRISTQKQVLVIWGHTHVLITFITLLFRDQKLCQTMILWNHLM